MVRAASRTSLAPVIAALEARRDELAKETLHQIRAESPAYAGIDDPALLADVTAHVVEMLGGLNVGRRDPALVRGLRYLYREQDKGGSWFGRWGVNHIYGVGAVLPALAAAGEDMNALAVHRAVRWLEARQNTDGGWGETCASYVDPDLRGRGESAPSQTAWALLGLVAAGRADAQASHRGARFLLERQRVREVRESDSRGRHTTTYRELVPLPSGGALIDTPGMRELQLWAGPDSLDSAFADVADLAQRCGAPMPSKEEGGQQQRSGGRGGFGRGGGRAGQHREPREPAP